MAEKTYPMTLEEKEKLEEDLMDVYEEYEELS